MLKVSFEKLVSYIPEEKRPDIKPLMKCFRDELVNPQIKCWRDYQMPLMGNPKLVDFAYNDWQPWKNDVIVAAFPKTGTTWLRDVCRYLIYEHDSEAFEFAKDLSGPHIYLEWGTETKYEIWEKLPWKRRVLGTHMSAGMLNLNRLRTCGVKIIYVIRNPKDQLVSFFNMLKNTPMRRDGMINEVYPRSLNKFTAAYLQGKHSWFVKKGEGYLDHVLSWYPHRFDDNVMLVYYEDMKQNPKKEISKLAAFLGVKVNDEEVLKIARQTSFEATKQRMDEVALIPNFYNKGNVGNWKEHLTDEHSDRIDKMVEMKMANTDIKFTYVSKL
uniref:sulfotransferase 1C2-like n=1 Tax=Ciona intestinalis TaxID=7719 RepID=UPI000EF4598D|nr:sulfotransferase 1C2-like [Ciona intestinalis]|eukprot:XP_009859123.2 sulfotransferase 1C2-like [Ciona intestinalis]